MKKKILCLILVFAMIFAVDAVALYNSGVCLAADNQNNELWLKTDYEYGLSRGQKFRISEGGAAPYSFNGDTAYVPLAALCVYTGSTYTLGEDGKTVTLQTDGNRYTLTVDALSWSGGPDFGVPPRLVGGDVYVSIMTARAIFGVYTFYNADIGLIIFSTVSMSYSRSRSSLSTQIRYLSNLLFDRVSGQDVYDDVLANSGAGVHPRLSADRSTFDRLRAVYGSQEELSGQALAFRNWVRTYTNRGVLLFDSLFVEGEGGSVRWAGEAQRLSVRQPYYIYDENGNRLVGKKTYSYVDGNGKTVTLECGGSGYGDGYDEGGRSNVSAQTARLMYLAFTWQITGEQKYADAFYLLGVELGKWEHWGEGHFLNCADGAALYAYGLDWIWHAFDNQTMKRAELCKILYDKAVCMGYAAISRDMTGTHKSTLMGNPQQYNTWGNNWNTVCASGMIMAALTVMEQEQYRTKSLYVIEKSIAGLKNCLLQYAPDGSYIESPSYWVYGTNTYFRLLSCLISAAGTDYGYFDTVGLVQSCYFAYYITDPNFYCWNYHDGGTQRLDYSYFYFVSSVTGDSTIAGMRDKTLFEADFSYDLMDILYFDPTLSEGGEDPDRILDYYSRGIETVTMRASWEPDALFTGLHVGANNVSHGDVDCGNFILRSGGYNWLADPGSENYNVGSYFGSLRYRYYRKSVESHNCVMILSSSLPRGQVFNSEKNSYARIDRFESDEYGSIAVSDMRVQYGNTCTAAKRGLMLTNSRSTVVVQDDMSFSSATNLVWSIASSHIYSVSEDGRTAYLRSYLAGLNYTTMRVTLLTEDENLRFEILESNSTILSDTITAANSGNPKASSPSRRLIIRANGVTEFHVAAVFEIIRADVEVVGYQMTPIDSWKTVSDEWVKEANKDIDYSEYEPKNYRYKASDLRRALDAIAQAESEGEKLRIAAQNYIITTDIDKENSTVRALLAQFMPYIEEYNRMCAAYNLYFSGVIYDFVG